MRFSEIINEGGDFYCPKCHDNLGKSSEVLSPWNAPASCGQCGWTDGKKPPKGSPTDGWATPKSGMIKFKGYQVVWRESEDYKVQPGEANTCLYLQKADGRANTIGSVQYFNGNVEVTLRGFPNQSRTSFPLQDPSKDWKKGMTKLIKAAEKKAQETSEVQEATVTMGNDKVFGVGKLPDWRDDEDASERIVMVWQNPKTGDSANCWIDPRGIIQADLGSHDDQFTEKAELELYLKQRGITQYVGYGDL